MAGWCASWEPEAAVAGTRPPRREMQAYGVRVGAIALKDIILPGDIRDILNQVVKSRRRPT